MIINIESITDAEFIDLQFCFFNKGYVWASQDKPNLIPFPTYSFKNEQLRTRSNGISLDGKTGKMYFTNVWKGMEKSFPNETIFDFEQILLNEVMLSNYDTRTI